jgi:hypothetical protein
VKTKTLPTAPMTDVAGLIRTLTILLTACKEGHRALQQVRQLVADGPGMVASALRNHQVDDSITWHMRTEAARAVSVQLQALQAERLEQLSALVPELDAGVGQLTAAMERQSAPRRSFWGGEPDSTIADAERKVRVEHLIAEGLPVLRDAKFWLAKHPQAS